MTYKQKLIKDLSILLFNRIYSDLDYTLNKLNIQDLEFLYLVKSGKSYK